MEKTMVTMEIQVPVHYSMEFGEVDDLHINPVEALAAVESHLEEHSDEISDICLDDYNERTKEERVDILSWVTSWRDAI